MRGTAIKVPRRKRRLLGVARREALTENSPNENEMMIMTEYAFPAQLLEELHAHWRSQQSSVSSTLPDDPALLRLLETCYHASLRTAELRATRCVLAYISTDTLAKTH